MRLAGLDAGQRQRVADLSLRKALAAIAEPAVAKSRDELMALPREELDRQRLAGLTQAVDISEEILAEDAFKNLTPEQREKDRNSNATSLRIPGRSGAVNPELHAEGT